MKFVNAAIAAASLVALAAVSPAFAGKAAPGAPVSYTAAQAAAGATEYAANCSRCHGAKLQGISAPALTGAASGLAGDSVSEAYTFISTQMPAGNPGGLTTKQYTDILSFILKSAGHHAGSSALTAASAKKSTTNV